MKAKIFTIFAMAVLMVSLMGTAVLASDSNSVADASRADSADLAVSSDNVASLATSDEDVADSSGIGKDKFRAFFTFNKKKKAEIKMRIAKKRMFEVGEKAKDHPEKAKQIAKEYENDLNEALDRFDQIAVDGDKEEVVRALRRTVIIKYKLENHKEKSSEIHDKILEKKSSEMTSDQLDKLDEVFSTIDEHIDNSLERVEQVQENLKARLIALGIDESTIDQKMSDFEDHLKAKKQEREDHMKEVREKMEEHRAEIKHRLEAEMEDSTDSSTDSEDSTSTDSSADSSTDDLAEVSSTDDLADDSIADTQVLN